MTFAPYFVLQEFVPPEIYSIYGANSIWFVDEEMVESIILLRKDLDAPCTINNWHTGGQYKNSGFRMPDTLVGGKLSQHKMKAAHDLKFRGIHPDQVRQHLRNTFGRYCFTTIEKDTPTWTHVDKRVTGLAYLLEVPYR